MRKIALTLAVVVAGGGPALAGDLTVDGKLISQQLTGEPPLIVSSTTKVDYLNADLLDGLDGGSYARRPATVVIVAKSGGDFTSIQAALDGISDASVNNRYVIRIGPGTFNEKVTMKPYVDLVGSGIGATSIVSDGSEFLGFAATVTADGPAELRELAVSSAALGVYNYAVGVHADGVVVTLRRVRIEASGGDTASYGIYNANNDLLEVDSCSVSVSGADDVNHYGIYNEAAGLDLLRSKVWASGSSTANYGIYQAADSGLFPAVVSYSQLSADTSGLRSDDEYSTQLLLSVLDQGGVDANGGTVNCFFVVGGGGANTSTCP
jgi:hypothetical protein